MTKMDEVVEIIHDLPPAKLDAVLDIMWKICEGSAKDGIALNLALASALAHKAHQFQGEHLSLEEWQKACQAAYDLPAPVWVPAGRSDA